jgi:UDP-N-acetylmuramoylalanine--D-glutamate ligase
MDSQGQSVTLVVGLGETGLAMAKWLARQGARCALPTAATRRRRPRRCVLRCPARVLFAGPFTAAAFAGVALIAISPGVPVQEAAVQAGAWHAWCAGGFRDRAVRLGRFAR